MSQHITLRTVEQPSGSWRLVAQVDTGTQIYIDDYGVGNFAYSEAKASRLVACSNGGISYDADNHDMFE